MRIRIPKWYDSAMDWVVCHVLPPPAPVRPGRRLFGHAITWLDLSLVGYPTLAAIALAMYTGSLLWFPAIALSMVVAWFQAGHTARRGDQQIVVASLVIIILALALAWYLGEAPPAPAPAPAREPPHKGDRLAYAARAAAYEAQGVAYEPAPVSEAPPPPTRTQDAPRPIAAIPLLARPPAAPDNLCTRHNGWKVITDNGRSWHCAYR